MARAEGRDCDKKGANMGWPRLAAGERARWNASTPPAARARKKALVKVNMAPDCNGVVARLQNFGDFSKKYRLCRASVIAFRFSEGRSLSVTSGFGEIPEVSSRNLRVLERQVDGLEGVEGRLL